MPSLKQYEITNDRGYTTTIKLSDADAKKRGLLGKDIDSEAKKPARRSTRAKQTPAPKNKQAPAPEDKAADGDGEKPADGEAEASAKEGFGEAFENKS